MEDSLHGLTWNERMQIFPPDHPNRAFTVPCLAKVDNQAEVCIVNETTVKELGYFRFQETINIRHVGKSSRIQLHEFILVHWCRRMTRKRFVTKCYVFPEKEEADFDFLLDQYWMADSMYVLDLVHTLKRRHRRQLSYDERPCTQLETGS